MRACHCSQARPDGQPDCGDPEAVTFHVISLMSHVCFAHWQVRRHAAEQLYLQLLSEEGGDCDGSRPGTALHVLAQCAWGGGIEGARAARLQLCGLLGLDAPKSRMAVATKARAALPAAARSEQAPYQALIDAAARR